MLLLALVALDLAGASVAYSPADKKAATVLIEEVEKRTGIRLPESGSGSIRLERGSGPAEGYRIRSLGGKVSVTGSDARGVLFGVGRLLREMRGRALPELNVAAAPKYPLRGHQLGYRPKTNSYDGWNVAMWDQYIRDLAIFGANAVELIPPRSDDDADSPHFPLPPMRMMIEMSRICAEYGMDVWIWYPAMDKDYSDPKTVEAALKEWAEVFRQLPRIDAVFVPGGDPGHTQPKHLMALLEKQTATLRRYHPKAGMWMSPQGFSKEWMEEWLGIMKSEPAWLAGVVFGPQIRMSLPELRASVPKRYPIRHYPDITHSRQCQYPVPDWDPAFAATEAREVINPRPLGQARIFRLLQPYTIGYLTYSEGCNDDVNKTVWSALGWDPEADVTQVLREYARYYIGERVEDAFAQGLLALERNWIGPVAANQGIYTTLQQFQSMERAANPATLLNWRFQQGLYRAYYDAYVRARVLRETEMEERAMDRLRAGDPQGAERILDEPGQAAPDWRARVFELAEALFQSVRMQLSVPRYKAIAVGRGANLDTIDVPLSNRGWLKQQIRKGPEGIREALEWTNPGPGGFYDDLGAQNAHLVRGPGFQEDPAFLRSSLIGFSYLPDYRRSWWDNAESLNDTPLVMRYTGLDPTAQYKIRVTYAGDSPTRRIRLEANGAEVHPLMDKPFPVRPVEFDLPVKGSEMTLRWTREPGLGGNGRGCSVAEVWIIRK
ncbi:MAG: glycoside hydrolase family 20 zincin-like fold domain-containing protein [Bryobacteraceae bacterium]